MTHVSLLDIAQAAGCSISTVSRALKNHPRLAESTRKRIQTLADEMGYIRDARLTELMTHLKKRHQHWDRPIIACVGGFPPGTSKIPTKGYLFGAYRQAAAMGYELKLFSINDPQLSPERLSRVLYNRGITGLFVGSMDRPNLRLELEWDLFSAVALGHSLGWPTLHRVSNHQYHSMRICFQNTRALGYKRVGFILLPRMDVRTDHMLTAGVLVEQEALPKAQRVPILKLESWEGGKFKKWYQRHQPDAVIYAGSPLPVFDWLDAMKLKAPHDLGVVNAGLHDTEQGVTGMLHDLHEAGAAGIDLLIAQMHKNERGIPPKPLSLLLEGTWVEGWTTRQQ